MKKSRSLIVSIFLVIFYTVLSANFEKSYQRHYFASYADLIDFFERPCLATSKFVQKPTEFHADIYQMRTLDQIMTACVYENRSKTVGHFISQVIACEREGTYDGMPVVTPVVTVNKMSYEIKQGPQQSISNWKVIAPDGREHDSAEYDANPGKFKALWDPVPGIPVSIGGGYSDGKLFLNASIGNSDVGEWICAKNQSIQAGCLNMVRGHMSQMQRSPRQQLQEAHNNHQKNMKVCERMIKKSELAAVIEKKSLLFSLWPPLPADDIIPYNGFEMSSYYETMRNTWWLINEIEKLDEAFDKRYGWGVFTTRHDMHKFKDMYLPAIDRIAEEFYKKYPSQRPKPFQAIRLSHAVAYRHYDTAKLTTLTEQWTAEGKNAGARSSLYLQRLKALNNTINSKGIMRDYSGKVKKHAPFTDEYADVFNNCYGTDLDQQLHEELCDTRIRMIEVVNHDKMYDYPDFYAPIVNRCTALAKQEKDVETAFNLADYSHDLVTIVSKGVELLKSGLKAMHKGQMLVNECDENDAFTQEDVRRVADFTMGTAYGTGAAAAALATPQYWVELATGVPILVFCTLGVVANVAIQGYTLNQAFWQKLEDPSSDAFDKHCARISQQTEQLKQSMIQSMKGLATLSAHDWGEHIGYLGTRFVLDSTAIHAAKLAAIPAGRKFINKIASVIESARTEEVMTEVGLVCKVAVDEGLESANLAIGVPNKQPSKLPQSATTTQPAKLATQTHPHQPATQPHSAKPVNQNQPSQQAKSAAPTHSNQPSATTQSNQPATPIQPSIARVLSAQEITFIESCGLKRIGVNTWQSPAGVIYGDDKIFGNSINHLFAHLAPDPLKNKHTIFNLPKDKMIALIDEAWMLKGAPLLSDPVVYIVDMKRIIGTNGETLIRIVVKSPGIADLRTAYPI